jgi:hypothetical protein
VNSAPRAACARLARALLLCAAAACPVHAEWLIDLSAAYTHDDNLGNGIEDEDRKSDHALAAGVRGGYYQPLGPRTGATLTLIAEHSEYFDYSGFTNFAAGAGARLRHKFGLGAQAPWALFSVQALHRDYRYDLRDGWQYDAGLTAGKLLTERLSLQGSVRYDRYEADDVRPPVLPGFGADAYDISGWNIGARLSYALTSNDVVTFGYAYRDGSVTAVTQPDLEVLEYSDAVVRDTIFGTSPRRVAYRLDGKTNHLSVAWSHAFGPHLSLSLSYAYRRTEGDGDLDAYYSNVVALNLGYSR